MAVDRAVLYNPDFLGEFASVLSQLELERCSAAYAKSRKSGKENNEERDTVSPFLVTDMVMATLTGVGRAIRPQRIHKASREQVNWDNARLPFHRSSAWLLLRVALRLVLGREDRHRELYKAVTAFHHACLLQAACDAGLGSDLRFAMGAKLTRRIAKLDPRQSTPWLRKIRVVMDENYRDLRRRWEKAQAEEGAAHALPKPSHLKQLRFQPDTSLHLENLNQHLAWISDRKMTCESTPGPGDATLLRRFLAQQLPELPRSRSEDVFALLELEAWIESNLSSWVASRLQRKNFSMNSAEQDLERLQALMDQYCTSAQKSYAGNPEALSQMCLNIMDFWVALDRIAGLAIPLLLEYDPGFPPTVFHSLVLPSRQQLVRLRNIEAYLSARGRRAVNGYPPAFSNFRKANSFAVRYFNSSISHQKILSNIVAEAERTQKRKLEEYEDLRSRYDDLSRRKASATHKRIPSQYSWQRSQTCTPKCEACQLDRAISRLRIETFEWPLPRDKNQCKAIVFEINVPKVVAIWRDVTADVFLRVFGTQSNNANGWDGGSKLWFAVDRPDLLDFASGTSCIQLASTVKPLAVTHYRDEHISTTSEKEVCVRPAFWNYDYFHSSTGIPSERVFKEPRVLAECSYASHQEPRLQGWTRSSEHTSNDVIAAQSDCPTTMSLEEFRAFGHVRSNVSLQWANILCQLIMPSLGWNKKSTYLLVMQACLEAGPPDPEGSVFRAAHSDLRNVEFVSNMVAALHDALLRMQENWQNDVGISLLTCLATRILSLAEGDTLTISLLDFLSRVRAVTIRWARKLLSRRKSSAQSDDDRNNSRRQILMAALTCMSTFDINPTLLRDVLSSPRHLRAFVEAAILFQNHAQGGTDGSNVIPLILSHRCWRVMHTSSEIVKNEVLEHRNSGFDDAILRFWPNYAASATLWSALPGSQGHILSGQMKPEGWARPVRISFNLLDGRLLVDGYPLSRLPPEYENHRAYVQLFGTQILEAVPSTLEGMRFSACHEQQGWQVHFAMIESELVIRAMRGLSTACPAESSRSDVYEFIPPWRLEGDVPDSFVRNYSHWLNLSSQTIEFRPVDKPWETSAKNWMLTRENGISVLKRDGCYLIDPHSDTAKALSAALGSIESTPHMDMTFRPSNRTLVVDLPRFSLSFILSEGDSNIWCKNYPGMCIDQCQSIGTLVGLRTKLVLRQSDVSEPATSTRIVLVPRGRLRSAKVSNHVKVVVDYSEGRRVKHDALTVDSMLGQLRTSGAIQSKLSLCLLHAFTSHCLPDPLTSRTGTEEALRLLDSASLRSFQRLDQESYDLLREIARISPHRRFYPEYLQIMERVAWRDDLPVLSQHDGFLSAVRPIVDLAHEAELLHRTAGEDGSTPSLDVMVSSSESLVRRATVRNAMFCVSEFGAEQHTIAHDRGYQGRQNPAESGCEKFKKAEMIAKCVVLRCQKLVSRPSTQLYEDILSATGESFLGGPKVDISFSLDLLEPGSLRGLWCGLHSTLTTESNVYKVAFFLSALVFAKDTSWDVVQALMALTNMRAEFQTKITPPSEEYFDLNYSVASLPAIVETIVEKHLCDFSRCPEANLLRLQGETKKEARQRRRSIWRCKVSEMTQSFLTELEDQWYSGWAVMTPDQEDYATYFEVESIMSEVRDVVALARRTHLFWEYLNALVQALSKTSTLPPPDHDKIPLIVDVSPLVENRQRKTSGLGFLSSSALFSQPAPATHRPKPLGYSHLYHQEVHVAEDGGPVGGLLDRLSQLCAQQGYGEYQSAYIDELRRGSLSSSISRYHLNGEFPELRRMLEEDLIKCQTEAREMRGKIDEALKGHSITSQVCLASGMYPRISPIFLLQRLSRMFWGQLSQDWRDCLVNYGLSLAYLQRADRLFKASSCPERKSDLIKELLNTGSHGSDEGDPLKYPESLLLELEQGILIRPVQQRIAAKMRDPPGGTNSVMQLNMGEGKSSVIVPIVSAALANGNCLVRVVVAKPQSKQMMHMLVSTLGGLINRRVFHLPVSRAVRLGESEVQMVRRMLETCKKDGGVLLVQPEHLLSFKLMGLEKTWAKNSEESSLGGCILETYRWFENVSRDIVDESDENFSVKFELIYTMGSQRSIDMSPSRWLLIQELMGTVLSVARELTKVSGADSVKGLLLEGDPASGRFPTIRILEESAGKRLVAAIAEQVCRDGLMGFPIQHQSKQMRQAALRYMLVRNLDAGHIAAVERSKRGFFGSSTTKNALLLLRGLLASGVIQFAFGQKRFRVNYGLAPDRRPRTMLAVPYRAKDSPAPRSEFSHPDVVIVLTCLTYYYQGLSDDEVQTCLEIVGASDQAEQEYALWAKASPGLKPSLRHFTAVNLKDHALCKESIFPALRYAKPLVDFYLANVVFPKEMREFPFKLSASGWDLGKAKQHPLTGFSGTTDSKSVLPLSVKALDLPDQRHTNSAVLECILRSENTVLELGGSEAPLSALTVDMLLDAVTSSSQPMRVILDVGAQIIELSNVQVARRWLDMVPNEEADAVIFFNDQDDLSVLTRDDVVDPFLTSPFAAHTERCLVFLDQAHTRGTDLRLPDSYRAAVTLGPGVTKDTLIQGTLILCEILVRCGDLDTLLKPYLTDSLYANAKTRKRPVGHVLRLP